MSASASTSAVLPSGEFPRTNQGKRISQLIALDRSRLEEYKGSSLSACPCPYRTFDQTQTPSFGHWQSATAMSFRAFSPPSAGHTSTVRGLIAPPVSSPHELRSFSNQLDYSIHLYDFPALNKDPILVATMRYVGDDFARDMREVSEDPETHRWWTMVRRFVRFSDLDSCITSAFVPET